MDKWVTVTKPGRATKEERAAKRDMRKFNPYATVTAVSTKHTTDEERSAPASSSAALTKHLLSTLSDESNPITHSDIYSRTDHVQSVATGHQRGDGSHARRIYLEDRSQKLEQQKASPSMQTDGPLRDVKLYINGYLSDTTDIEMKRIVTLAGGQIMHTAARATHIVTSQQLNGSKTHKILNTKSRSRPHVVRPEWVTDSVACGKRKPERQYAVIKDKTNGDLSDHLVSRS
ncbi:hypothetical protein PLICRDRAFT_149102 [Plicaturopsis crispa FD-325 SS-3]|nr:hypothetical protein PLICRDRAFT_149102 [Plicaturopsis crispa FD-325 SS-3]